jgi:hypothetical protein
LGEARTVTPRRHMLRIHRHCLLTSLNMLAMLRNTTLRPQLIHIKRRHMAYIRLQISLVVLAMQRNTTMDKPQLTLRIKAHLQEQSMRRIQRPLRGEEASGIQKKVLGNSTTRTVSEVSFHDATKKKKKKPTVGKVSEVSGRKATSSKRYGSDTMVNYGSNASDTLLDHTTPIQRFLPAPYNPGFKDEDEINLDMWWKEDDENDDDHGEKNETVKAEDDGPDQVKELIALSYVRFMGCIVSQNLRQLAHRRRLKHDCIRWI